MVLLTDRGGGMHGMLWDRAPARAMLCPDLLESELVGRMAWYRCIARRRVPR